MAPCPPPPPTAPRLSPAGLSSVESCSLIHLPFFSFNPEVRGRAPGLLFAQQPIDVVFSPLSCENKLLEGTQYPFLFPPPQTVCFFNGASPHSGPPPCPYTTQGCAVSLPVGTQKDQYSRFPFFPSFRNGSPRANTPLSVSLWIR